MVSPQWPTLVASALALTAICCIFRLHVLGLISTYSALVAFLVLQVATVSASSLAGVQSDTYAFVYLGLLMAEWIVYGFMLKEIYSLIFSKFPGIAVLGEWSIYGATGATSILCILSFAAARHLFIGPRTLLNAVTITAHSLTFGFAALVVIILFIVSRYPVPLHKNVLVNCVLFSIVLLGEAAGLIVDAFTRRTHTAQVNRTVNILEIVCLAIWPVVLSREGQTIILKFRRTLGDEAQLLTQLSTLNGALMRFARNKSALS